MRTDTLPHAHHCRPVPLAAALAAASVITLTLDAQPSWKLTETLRLGGDESGPASFVTTASLEADAKGRLYAYDKKTQDIRVFGADGKFVRVIGRLGSGPGELRNAEGIVFARDGNLWVRDAANARFTIFDGDGRFVSAWTARFCWSQGAWSPMPDRKGRLIDEDCVVGDGRERRTVLVAYKTDRSGVDTLGVTPTCGDRALMEAGTWITRAPKMTSYRAIPFFPRSLTARDADGAVWCVANSATYEIVRLAPGSKDSSRITRTLARLPVTTATRDSVIEVIEAKGPTELDFGRIPKEKPAIDRVTVDDQDRLWVQRATSAGTMAFDIYSKNGRALASVTMQGCRTSTWLPFVVRRDQVYTVCLDDDDVQYVTRYRVSR